MTPTETQSPAAIQIRRPTASAARQDNYTDSETGLSLATYRYYDPNEGRWLTRDPIGYAGGMNLYAYCDGNPVGTLDPIGLCSDETEKNWWDFLKEGWAETYGSKVSRLKPGESRWDRFVDNYSRQSALINGGRFVGNHWQSIVGAGIVGTPLYPIPKRDIVDLFNVRNIIQGRGYSNIMRGISVSGYNIPPWLRNTCGNIADKWKNVVEWGETENALRAGEYIGTAIVGWESGSIISSAIQAGLAPSSN